MRCWRCSGLSLIEVVAALALLGALLSGIVLARGRHLRQWHTAREKSEAVQAADALLEQWWQSPATLPRPAAGELADDLVWQTHVLEPQGLEQLDVQRVRLEVMKQPLTAEPTVLATVELVVPMTRTMSEADTEQ